MKIRLYQIRESESTSEYMYMSLFALRRTIPGWDETIDGTMYDAVYTADVDCTDLEDVYNLLSRPERLPYKGRPMSVSDVLEIIVPEGETEAGFYYCDNIGFKACRFDMNWERKITVVMLKPGETAKVEIIPVRIDKMQEIVGGYIEAYYPFDDSAVIVCNDSGKIEGLPFCRAIRDDSSGEIFDVIAGNFFICAGEGEEFTSLSEEQQKKYLEKFRYPEKFVISGEKDNRTITAVAYNPEAERNAG